MNSNIVSVSLRIHEPLRRENFYVFSNSDLINDQETHAAKHVISM